MRLLQLHNLFPLNVYDIARFACQEYFAAEYLPASDSFADGQGPGLFARRFGSRNVPTAVEGSEVMRIYQLGVLTRDDGQQQLVGLGVRTADLFADDLPLPQRWALKTPDPLCIFYSVDGEVWSTYELGAIEKHDGDYPLADYQTFAEFTPKEEDWLWNRPASIQNALMNSTARWREGINEWGARCLWTCSGVHLVEWDGYDARVTPLGQRATALALANGRFYFSAGSRTSIEAEAGVLAITTVDVTSLKPPLLGESRIVIVPAGTNLLKVEDKPGTVSHSIVSVGRVGGQWLILLAREWVERSARGESTKQELAAIYLPTLPTEPLSIETYNLQYVELTNAQEYFDLGRKTYTIDEPGKPPDPVAIRYCSGRAFIYQRKDFQDHAGVLEIADMNRETMPVLELLCNPSLSDFDITAAISYEEGHLVGTADGYLLSVRLAENRVDALERLDGAILRILAHSGRFYALTARGLWHSPHGADWEVLREAEEGFSWQDAIVTEDGRLFVVGNDGVDSQVAIYNVETAAVLLAEDTHAAAVLSVAAEFDSHVYLFGSGEDGEYFSYNADNEVTAASEELFENETVTAAVASEDVIFLGTQSGKLLIFEDVAWSEVTDIERAISVLALQGDSILIGFSDGAGNFGVWDGDEVSTHDLNAPCATDARVFLPCVDCVNPPCGTVVLTDAGPVFWNCVNEGEAVWFSEIYECEPGEVFDEVTAFPLAEDGSPLIARALVGPESAGNDLSQYQPLEPAVRVRLLHDLDRLRFAVIHPVEQQHKFYEFAAYRKPWTN